MQKRRYMKHNFAIKPPERLSQPKKNESLCQPIKSMKQSGSL